jgi:Toprim domain
MTAISWDHIEAITQGQLGRHMAICPECSPLRRTPQKRHSKVLAVTLHEPEFAVFYCNHCGANGYCHPDRPTRVVVDIAEQQRRRAEADRHAAAERQQRTNAARAIWREAQPFRGSPAEVYLADTRGIGEYLDTFGDLHHVFRFDPSCIFGDERRPCLIAAVRDIKTNAGVAIHRTALTADNPPQRIERKALGPIGGGAIKISPDHEVTHGLLIGEGIETVLSASKAFQFKPAWSLIDANNLAKFPVLSGVESVTIAVDNDSAGQAATDECIRRQINGGVEVIAAQTDSVGDFNDLIRGEDGRI